MSGAADAQVGGPGGTEPSARKSDTLPKDRAFFGHPVGLSTLFFTEMWERFATTACAPSCLLPDRTAPTAGWHRADVRRGARLRSSALGLPAVLPRRLDRGPLPRPARRSLFGGIGIAAGHLLLAIPHGDFFYLGLILIALGTGLLKPNISTIVGQLYKRGGPASRRSASRSSTWASTSARRSRRSSSAPCAPSGATTRASPRPRRHGHRPDLLRGRPEELHGAGLRRAQEPARRRPSVARCWRHRHRRPPRLRRLVAARVPGALGRARRSIDTLSYIAVPLAPIAFFITMYRSPRVDRARSDPRLIAYIPLFVAAMLFFMIFEQAATTLAHFPKGTAPRARVLGFTVSPRVPSSRSTRPRSSSWLPCSPGSGSRTKDRPPTPYKFAIGLGARRTVRFLVPGRRLAPERATAL